MCGQADGAEPGWRELHRCAQHQSEASLRIDVTQHQMHATQLARLLEPTANVLGFGLPGAGKTHAASKAQPSKQ
jgi:hypothetical protein